jgi:diguanylate cyclase (GGDEF)-like protein
MKPDTLTLFVVGTVICGLMTLLHLLVSRYLYKSAFRIWSGANLALCTGCLVFATRSVLPSAVPLLLGNGAFVLGIGLIAAGIDVLDGKPLPRSELLIGLALAVAGLAISIARGNSLGERIVIVSLAMAYYAVRASWSLLGSRPHQRRIRSTCAVILLTFSFLYVVRGFAVYAGLLSFSSATTGTSGGAIRVLAIAMTVTWNFCLLFLALDRAASVDELTGLLNRRATISIGCKLIKEAISKARPVSVLMSDLDNFKEVNDGFGHHVGDAVLRAFAVLAKQTVRSDDVIGRLGGDEFCIVLPGSDAREALQVAERLRSRGEQNLKCVSHLPTTVTISMGIVTHATGKADFLRLLKEADTAMYKAKALGRNRIACVSSASMDTLERRTR